MSDWEIVSHAVAITGRVSDSQTKEFIAGAFVQITDAPPAFKDWVAAFAIQYGVRWDTMIERPDQTQTSADGHFHFMDLPVAPEKYKLRVSLPALGSRYGAIEIEVKISNGINNKKKIATADIVLPPTTITGGISDKNTGTPVVLAEVRVEGSNERCFSNSDGKYLLTGLETGARRVSVSAQGYQPTSQIVTIEKAGNEQIQDFKLNPLQS